MGIWLEEDKGRFAMWRMEERKLDSCSALADYIIEKMKRMEETAQEMREPIRNLKEELRREKEKRRNRGSKRKGARSRIS